MKFATQQDIEAPISAVFEMMSSFETFEDAASKYGADVKRVDNLSRAGIGMHWNVQFIFKGQSRVLDMEITQFDRPKSIALDMTSEGLFGPARVDLEKLSDTKTRIAVGGEIRASSLKARVLLQPLKLAKSTLDQRFQERVAKFVHSLERQYKDST
ncbi:MAG: SRPBCC family protein [Paracoccaceae bacterium]|nr:SRPBCC family protein [Paracoccaceae bacterium]